MQLGKALLGAIIGAAVGIVLMLVLYLTTGWDKSWLSIPFAIITGIGVRMFTDTKGHASYVRGALTMAIALAAYIGGWMIVAQVATARANAEREKPPVVNEEKAATEPGAEEGKEPDATAAESKDTEGKEADANAAPRTEQPKAQRPKPAPRSEDSGLSRALTPRPTNYSPTDIICLAIAALVAYELGRGSGAVTPSGQSSTPMSVGTHPDA